MTDADNLKCACAHCGGVISYAAADAGRIVQCARCGEKSQLPAESKDLELRPLAPLDEKPAKKCPFCGFRMLPEEEEGSWCAEELRKTRRRKYLVASVGGVTAIATIAVGWSLWMRHAKHRAETLNGPALTPAAAFSKAPLVQPPTHPAKSIGNLKIGKFFLETDQKGKGPAVATGKILNDSDNMHFGVKVDLDVLDAAGAKIGSVSDMITQLGPRDNWNFIAAVTNANAASVRFAAIKEDQ